ncbi:hypothetical protein BDQ12DRAFT_494983 [Crucibulum laeve]|uniref:Uncharacterized protein n=1 Tax=Crucibulum laeve TaxID=68775 RepID=A0A5C3MGV3_9AGAR|nr:hypothetical protein BDQ12DRAFT_494983 [Crucibulum laeve]
MTYRISSRIWDLQRLPEAQRLLSASLRYLASMWKIFSAMSHPIPAARQLFTSDDSEKAALPLQSLADSLRSLTTSRCLVFHFSLLPSVFMSSMRHWTSLNIPLVSPGFLFGLTTEKQA